MRWIRDNSLTIALLTLFVISVTGQLITGQQVYNEERQQRQQPPIESLYDYARSAHFESALFENWESEFLQMGLYVFLTMFLYQRGSSESQPPPDQPPEPIKYKRKRYFRGHPFWRKVYEHSLSSSLFILFVISMFFHARGSNAMINEANAHLGQPLIGFWQTFAQDEFWFESFQNWQSEFFSVTLLVVMSIFLREKGSPQSKEVDAPHEATEN